MSQEFDVVCLGGGVAGEALAELAENVSRRSS
jgi:flavin-dependent dehydrogenase